MIFRKRRREQGELDPALTEQARARYVLRTAKTSTLKRILGEVGSGLSAEERGTWARELNKQGITVSPETAEVLVRNVLTSVQSKGQEVRQALGQSVTPAVAKAVKGSPSASPAFAGFSHSPEAREVGVPEPDAKVARQRPRAEPPFLPGTTPVGRR